MSNLEVTLYLRPDGRKLRTLIKNVWYEDARYFLDNGVIISMEEADNEFIVYGDWPGNQHDEVIVLAGGRSCEETLAELRQIIEDYKRNEQVSP